MEKLMKLFLGFILSMFISLAYGQVAMSPQAQSFATKAEQGDLPSINMMGNLYKTGSLGLEKNWIESKKWFEKGAQLNYPASHFNLGMLYETGGNGITQDLDLAKKYYENASKLGFAKADERLSALKLSVVASKPSNESAKDEDEDDFVHWVLKQRAIKDGTSASSDNNQIRTEPQKIDPCDNKYYLEGALSSLERGDFVLSCKLMKIAVSNMESCKSIKQNLYKTFSTQAQQICEKARLNPPRPDPKQQMCDSIKLTDPMRWDNSGCRFYTPPLKW